MSSTMIKSISPVKKKFSEESQVFITDFQNRISELDSTLPNFTKQIDGLISTYELLQNSAIEADFYTSKSVFSEIIHHFEETISLLSYQHIDVDWITKGLLFEAINMMSQIINEYCFDRASNQNWMKLQDNLFNQLTEHFRQKSDQSTDQLPNQLPNQLLKETSDELDSLEISDVETKDRQCLGTDENEPFNLTDFSEEFDLFDVDFGLESDDAQVLAQNPTQEFNQSSIQEQQFETSDGFLLIQIDDQIDNQVDHQFESLSSSKLTKDLLDIFDVNTSSEPFTNYSHNNHYGNNFLGDEDETELLGTSWDEKEVSIEDDIDNTLIEFSSLKSWGEMDADDALALAQLEAGFALPEELDDSDCRIDFSLSEIDGLLEDNENIFCEPLISIKNAISRSQSDLLMIEQLAISANYSPSAIDEKTMLLDHIKDQDFSTSDIDTAIEMSPIYRNNTDEFKSAWEDVSLTSFPSENKLNADKKLDYFLDFGGEDVDTQINAFSSMDYDGATNNDSKASSNVDSNIEAIAEQPISLAYEIENSAFIRMPLHHLTNLGDLSEDLLVRKGNLDIYLHEIKKLTGNAQQSLQTLQSDLTGHVAIASLQNTLQNTLVQMVTILERAEQQTSTISHDVHDLRKNLGHVLRQPISSLLSRYPRILRDLSLQYGKQVELMVQGAEVGIERAIADVVVEPLDLLIRNAFEYGIESPSDRQRLGKLVQGKIEIIALQTEENTIIKVCDDGCGVDDVVQIEDSNAQLSNSRKKLQKIGGTISAQSQQGKGTQFTIILPNTISLVRVLLIEINQMCLAMPSKGILEVLPITSSRNLASANIQETLLWHDQEIPIVRLNSLLKLNCRSDNSKPANTVPSYLIFQHENNLLALAVDGCWHDQDATFHQIEGDISLSEIFMGTVILGNDQAIALLNPAELINQVRRSPSINVSNISSKVFLNSPFNSSADDEIQISHISHPNPVNLNSLADFFDAGDSPESNFFDLAEPSVHLSENASKPENLESSGIFISNQNAPVRLPSHQPKVLIVESSANIRRYLSMTLVRAGFLTEQANNGQEAIAFLKENINGNSSIDIVITDLVRPQMNGFQLLKNIRADADLQNLPVVVLASHENENDRKLALDLGANAYFSKPYHEQELMTTLQQMVM